MNRATLIAVLTTLIGLLATQGADAATGFGAWLLLLSSFCSKLPGGVWYALLSIPFSGVIWSVYMRRTSEMKRRPTLSAHGVAILAGPIPMLVASWGQGPAAIATALLIGTVTGAVGGFTANAVNSAMLKKPDRPLPAPKE